MTIMTARVLSPYSGNGTSTNPYHPEIVDNYSVLGWSDVTGRSASTIIPAVNLLIVEIITDDTTLATISQDTRYIVLWQEQQTDQQG